MRLPEVTGPAEHQDYLALLDRCLLDRQLSAHEAQALVQFAEELGLSRGGHPLTCIDPSLCIATMPSTHPGFAENRKSRRRSRPRPEVDTSMGGQAGQAFYFSPFTAAIKAVAL
ncbi:hypothetical protein [Cryobacterium sp. Hb1]|uniref:hypothetical protein n=1 Tax=Cryobacterium sp. Hb1 TaxID=1259147 RepID=UPI00106B3E1E|nr:hypothetical protein [Cryobacterium sp. Hb1]TFD71598.1 hypothetical protein E3T38_01980 [Cryobacterium sp. Hb1]